MLRYLTLVVAMVPLMWLGVSTLIGWEQTCCGEKWGHLADDPSYVEVGLQEALQAGYSPDIQMPCYRGPIPHYLQLAISAAFAMLPIFVYWIIQDLIHLVQFVKKLGRAIGAKR